MLLQTYKDYGLLMPDTDCFAALAKTGKMQQHTAKDYGLLMPDTDCFAALAMTGKMQQHTAKYYVLLMPDTDCFAALAKTGKMQLQAAKDYGKVTGSAERLTDPSWSMNRVRGCSEIEGRKNEAFNLLLFLKEIVIFDVLF